MSFDFTWFDIILVVLLAGVMVLGARRGVAGLVAGLVAVFSWPIINLLGRIDALVGFFLALVAGWFVVGMLARNAYATGFISASSDAARTVLGGLGGTLMGLALVVALALSFPITSTPSAGPGAFSYPSDALPNWLHEGVNRSAIQRALSEPPARGGLGLWRGSAFFKLFAVPDRSGN